MIRTGISVGIVSLSVVFASLRVQAADHDISIADFYADAAETVVLHSGQTAVMTESELITPLTLVNDPKLGDPQAIQAPIRFLSFIYQFDESPDGNDQFSAFLFDADVGPYFGTLETFTITSSNSGTAVFDLSQWSGKSLGVLFELAELDPLGGTLGSKVTVSQLQQNEIFADTDADGMPDSYEQTNNLNPFADDGDDDADTDKLTNYSEYLYGTSPNRSDTDGDGLLDGDEVRLGLDPLVVSDCPIELCPPSSLLKIIILLEEQRKISID